MHALLLSPAGLAASDDSFTTPANRPLQTNVSYNDAGMQKDMNYGYIITSPITYTTAEGGSAQLPTYAVSWSNDGRFTFSPQQLNLKAGVVVTFTYAILPYASGAIRSNNATVAITIADPVGPFPPPPSPPVGTGTLHAMRHLAWPVHAWGLS